MMLVIIALEAVAVLYFAWRVWSQVREMRELRDEIDRKDTRIIDIAHESMRRGNTIAEHERRLEMMARLAQVSIPVES